MFTGRFVVFGKVSNQFQIIVSGGGQFAIGHAGVAGDTASFGPAQMRVDVCGFGVV